MQHQSLSQRCSAPGSVIILGHLVAEVDAWGVHQHFDLREPRGYGSCRMKDGSQLYRETAAELRRLAEEMRWAENRDHLLDMAEQFNKLGQGQNEAMRTPERG